LRELRRKLLGVSRSGCYDWARRSPSDRALSDAWLTEKITTIHRQRRRVYGARRIHAELRLEHGVRVGRKRVERLMRQAGLSGLVRRKRGKTTIRVPGVRVADDLVERDFKPAAPNVLWVADITLRAVPWRRGRGRRPPLGWQSRSWSISASRAT
jgi:putative transposase